MKPLLRYLYLKYRRQGAIAAALIGPLVLVLAPLLMGIVTDAARGTFTWPLHNDTNGEAGLRTIPDVLLIMMGQFGAIAGAFAFTREAERRALASLVLASSPMKIVTAAVAFSTALTVAAYLSGQIGVAVISVSIEGGVSAFPRQSIGELVVILLIAAAGGASAGVAMMSIAPTTTMIVPALMIALVTPGIQVKYFGLVSVAAGIAEIAILMTVAAWFTRRRCAA